MTQQTATSRPVGTGFLGLLQLLFIGAKLFGAIDWPWVWVLAPLWISGVVLLILFVFLVFAFAVADRKLRGRR